MFFSSKNGRTKTGSFGRDLVSPLFVCVCVVFLVFFGKARLIVCFFLLMARLSLRCFGIE